MNNFHKFSLFCLFIFFAQLLIGQNSEIGPERKKIRNLHASFGAFSSINYDQKMIGSRKADHSLNAGIQIGYMTDFGLLQINYDHVYSASLNLIGLLGKGRSFAELGLGYGISMGIRPDRRLVQRTPRGFAGYRFNFEKGLLRIGLGLPELLYLGGGIRF